MAEYYKGRRISSREEDGLPPLTDEQIAQARASFAEFDARRAAVPEDQRIHLSSRFGDDDFGDDEVPRNPDGSRKDRTPGQEQD